MTNKEMQLMIDALKAENASLKASKATGTVTMKIAEKGGVSVYGLGRFPVTLYQEQWAKLFAAQEAIKGFIADNQAVLKVKDAA